MGEPIPSFIEIVDSLFVKGLSIDRSENGSPKDYWIWNDIEDMGLLIYTSKKISDPLEFTKSKKELDNIYDSEKKAILRILLKIKSP